MLEVCLIIPESQLRAHLDFKLCLNKSLFKHVILVMSISAVWWEPDVYYLETLKPF